MLVWFLCRLIGVQGRAVTVTMRHVLHVSEIAFHLFPLRTAVQSGQSYRVLGDNVYLFLSTEGASVLNMG